MKPALDPAIDYKRLVAEGYNTCAEAYEQTRREMIQPEIKWLKSQLPNQARILDIGCGSGLPVTRELAKRFHVTGVDISAEQIRRARQNVRHAEFLHSDIIALDFPAASFEAVTALYTIFHIPRGEHDRLFRNMHRWLQPGGYLLATLTHEPQESCAEPDFFGAPMYWSSYGMAEYRAMLAEAGFEILREEETEPGWHFGSPARSYPLVICKTGL